jgi:phospholipid/cholesterol/gamma-HCH transport system ATP-binding protein
MRYCFASMTSDSLTSEIEVSVFSLHNVWLSGLSGHSVLKGIHLEIPRGETFALIGPSGEGKTVLLKLMAGLLRPDRGEVLFQGVALVDLSARRRSLFSRRIGMTFQKSGLFDSLTCAQNLDFPLRELTALSQAERERKIEKALEEVGLVGQGALMVHEMSGGMQKRLGIARALILSPEAILYDDPTAGLDPITSRSILELILEMKRKYEMTVVLVTSQPDQAYRMADRIGFLYKGDFLQIGSSEIIQASSQPVVKQFVGGLLEGPLTVERRQLHDRA